MKNKILIFLSFIGLLGLIASCEKDETQVVFSDNVVAPAIQAIPNLTLERAKATDTLVFEGKAVNPGFEASANYFLEAAAAGTDFADPVQIYSGVQNRIIKITVSDLNGILIKKFPADQVSSVDFRIRAVLVVDAGTGAPGTGTDLMEYISEVVTADVTIFGLPRLDLIDSGKEQKIESAAGDGVYTGFVKLNPANPFTLFDPDGSISYGDTGGALAVDGAGIVSGDAGWHILTVNTNDMTYGIEAYMIGLVGSATPNGWDAPDQKMDYDVETGTWSITIDLIDGEIKFRLNDGWAWNLGGTFDNLVHNGANVPVSAGNYTITLTITDPTPGVEAGTMTIVSN